MQTKGIIFDLDGTLINSIPYHYKAFKLLLKDYNIKIKPKEIEKLMGMSTLDILKRLDSVKKSGLRLADLREERHYYYFKLIGEKKLEFKGTINAIKKLKKQGIKMAIATGSSNIIYFHSTQKKFRKLFDAVITIDDVTKGKPAPDCFLIAAAKLGLRPEECIVVGDSVYDKQGAKAAGMKFIGVLTGLGTKKQLGKNSIKSAAELQKIIK
jgi:beta-phosphoglucomutase